VVATWDAVITVVDRRACFKRAEGARAAVAFLVVSDRAIATVGWLRTATQIGSSWAASSKVKVAVSQLVARRGSWFSLEVSVRGPGTRAHHSELVSAFLIIILENETFGFWTLSRRTKRLTVAGIFQLNTFMIGWAGVRTFYGCGSGVRTLRA